MEPQNREKILYRKQSRYNDITVMQKGDFVTLYSPKNVIQSEINLRQPLKPHLEFNCSLLFSLAFCPMPSSILALGLGGGVVPWVLSNSFPEAQVDVVEIDDEMLKVAKNYFGFTPSDRLRVHIADARAFIDRLDRAYDLIILDTYCGIDLAESVDNRSFFEDCAELVSDRGIMAVNLIPRQKGYIEERLKWLRQVPGNVYLLRGLTRANEVVFAGRQHVEKSTLLKNMGLLKKTLPFNLKGKRLLKRFEDYNTPIRRL